MTSNRFRPTGSYPILLIALALGVLAMAACQPIQDPSLMVDSETEEATGGTIPPATDQTPEVDAAMATVSTRSLRVRELPNEDSEVVAGARSGETYAVIGISSDGAWIQIEIDRAEEGTGWVSADFVTLEGDITNIETVEIETVEPSEPAESEEAAAEAGEESDGEATAEATPEPTEEPAEEAGEATDEAATDEAAEEEPEATPEATDEPAEETTDEAADEESEATPEPTDEPVEETEAEESGDLGTVTISTDLPLRVRSAPTTEEDNKVGNVFDGDTYQVLEITDDGLWVRIDVPELELENGGWVSADFVIFNEAE